MGKICYCHICGEILEEEQYQIITKDVDSKKKSKLFDTCNSCAVKVSKMMFSAMKLSPNMRKNPIFTSIIIKRSKSVKYPLKSKLMFDVLPHQLDEIKALEVDKTKLKLRYKSGNILYQEHQVKQWMLSSTKNLVDAMVMVWNHQTDDEKKKRETKYANDVGFNKPDASFMTGMSRIYECKGYESYSDKQLVKMEKIMLKYIKQVTLYINAEGKILEGI